MVWVIGRELVNGRWPREFHETTLDPTTFGIYVRWSAVADRHPSSQKLRFACSKEDLIVMYARRQTIGNIMPVFRNTPESAIDLLATPHPPPKTDTQTDDTNLNIVRFKSTSLSHPINLLTNPLNPSCSKNFR